MTAIDDKILTVLDSEYVQPSAPVTAMCEKIMARHEGRVQALVYYGSSLRAMNDTGKMLDFYVLVDSYRKTHKNPVRALLNAAIPPAVYYLENENEDGSLSTCKYSILSLKAFQSRCNEKALLSQVWGRFSQPCIVLFPVSDTVKTKVQMARIAAIKHMANVTRPLMNCPVSAAAFWARGFRESYRTELRPEKSGARSQEIVTRYQDRYDAISDALFGPPKDGLYTLPDSTKSQAAKCKRQWWLRRFIGKPATAIRVLNSAFTFDGGLDYVLHKLKNHSGETIEVTESQRKHPILWSPVLGWKLYKKGAFR